METTENAELVAAPSVEATEAAEPDASPVATSSAPAPAEKLAFVYALGQVESRFPSLAVEKEFAQASASPGNAGLTDRQTLSATLAQAENRYLARKLCWVFTVEGLETYLLAPRDPADLQLLVESVRAEPSTHDLDLIIGVRGPIAGPEVCNGLALPIVMVDQLYSFDRDSLIESIPLPDAVSAKHEGKFRSAAGELFDQLHQLADNAGAIDEHRALNYLTVRYPHIYAQATEQYERNFSFTGVEVLLSQLSGVRSIVDVVFSYTHRETDIVEKYFVRVDVTEEFPFLVSKMSPFYDR